MPPRDVPHVPEPAPEVVRGAAQNRRAQILRMLRERYEQAVIMRLDFDDFEMYHRIARRATMPGTVEEKIGALHDLVQLLRRHPDLVIGFNIHIREFGRLDLDPMFNYIVVLNDGRVYNLQHDRPFLVRR